MSHSCDMAKDDPQFRIRMPADLKRRAEEAAEQNHRSLNAEIVQRVADSFDPASMAERLDDAERGLAELLAKAILAQEEQRKRTQEKTTAEEAAWIKLWRDMNEPQRHMALAMLKGAMDFNAS